MIRIGLYSDDPKLQQILSSQRCLQQRRSCVPCRTPWAPSFVADGIGRGFTAPYGHPPRLRGHLTHCLPHRHAGLHSFSFGPSSMAFGLAGPAIDYDDLC